jgi:hypothetical protein
MPSDVSVDIATPRADGAPAKRLPIGIGLSIGACASIALWACIGFGLRALFA